MHVADAISSVELEDAVIRDTQSEEGQESFGMYGRGINIQDGASLTGKHLLVTRSKDDGVFSTSNGTTVLLEDSVIQDTSSQESNGEYGRGIGVQDGASLTGKRLILERNQEVGIAVQEAAVTLEDVAVLATESQLKDGKDGHGIGVDQRASLTGTRLEIASNRSTGVFVSGSGTAVELNDSLIRDTRSRAYDGEYGRGIEVQLGASLTGKRVEVRGNRDAGVVAASKGTTVILEDAVVRDTDIKDCAKLPEGGCIPKGMEGASREIGSYCEGYLELNRFVIEGSSTLGAQIAYGSDETGKKCLLGGSMYLSNGSVSGFEIGVNIQVADYDLSTLQNNVIWDNRQNISSAELQVPDPSEILGGAKRITQTSFQP